MQLKQYKPDANNAIAEKWFGLPRIKLTDSNNLFPIRDNYTHYISYIKDKKTTEVAIGISLYILIPEVYVFLILPGLLSFLTSIFICKYYKKKANKIWTDMNKLQLIETLFINRALLPLLGDKRASLILQTNENEIF